MRELTGLSIPSSLDGVGRTDTLSKGAQKALGNFIKDYGRDEGERIFLKKADEQGTGSTLRQKTNSVYKKGAKIGVQGRNSS